MNKKLIIKDQEIYNNVDDIDQEININIDDIEQEIENKNINQDIIIDVNNKIINIQEKDQDDVIKFPNTIDNKNNLNDIIKFIQ